MFALYQIATSYHRFLEKLKWLYMFLAITILEFLLLINYCIVASVLVFYKTTETIIFRELIEFWISTGDARYFIWLVVAISIAITIMNCLDSEISMENSYHDILSAALPARVK